jgi:hypothetical protein
MRRQNRVTVRPSFVSLGAGKIRLSLADVNQPQSH